jgi:hypothetical protein
MNVVFATLKKGFRFTRPRSTARDYRTVLTYPMVMPARGSRR